MSVQVWQWQLSSVAILLAWLELVLFIRKIPRFGIFVVMFTDIFWTFLQFLPVFFLFIVAFALTFYTLFGNQVSVGLSLALLTATILSAVYALHMAVVTSSTLCDVLSLGPLCVGRVVVAVDICHDDWGDGIHNPFL